MDAELAAEQFAGMFPRVYRRFHRRIGPAEYRLTSESLAVVQHLADAGPLTVTEAARHMDRSQAAMSEMIARLVARGLLARMPDERDRRRTLVWLTPAGRDGLASARSVLSPDLLTGALSQMPPADRRRLIDSVRVLLETQLSKGDEEP